MASHEILVSIDTQFGPRVNAASLANLARRVLEAESTGDCELGIVVTNDENIRNLNRTYAGEDKPTDVLSFSLLEGEQFVSPDGTERLGEVIMSFETAERQAQDAGHPLEDEMAHLLVHGVLHLLGYDHVEPGEERVMRGREDKLLGSSRH